MTDNRELSHEPTPTRMLLRMSLPAVLIGVGSALSLMLLDLAAEGLEHVLWHTLPGTLGITGDTPWWIVVILTAAGLATGLLIRFTPGHAGPDPATETFVPHAPPLSTVPSLAVAAIVTLASGVSLGPEAPIIVINAAVAVWICARALPTVGTANITIMVVAGTFGALFGSPVGAALLLTGVVIAKPSRELLWDRLFLPMVAASAGALVMMLRGGQGLTAKVARPAPDVLVDIPVGLLVMVAGVAVGLVLLLAFPHVHRLFHRWRNPILPLTVAGLLLGVLGAAGGPITMFKGLDQMQQLFQVADRLTVWQLVGIVLIKTVAVLIATTSGFRGGRVFPAVFIGAAVGVLAWAIVPGIPPVTAVAAGVLGVSLVIVRDGWLCLFIAAVVAGDVAVLPVLCMILLPGWLLVARMPQMILPEPEPVDHR